MICKSILVTLLLLAAQVGSSSSDFPHGVVPGRWRSGWNVDHQGPTSSFPNSTCHGCGNITIPFPLGTNLDSGCVFNSSFLVTCDHTFVPPKPFLNSSNLEVLGISPDGLIRVADSVASYCYDNSGMLISSTVSELTSSSFPISSTWNKFTTVGSDTYALIEGSDEWKQTSAGCVSWCDSIDNVVNRICSGIGCCQTLIPKGVKDFLVDIQSYRNHTRVQNFNPCGYAFVVETKAFEFSSSDLINLNNRKTVPIVLDWSVGNVSCQEALRHVSTFACRAKHSECSDSSSGLGYLCKCLAGFHGNPYLPDGCHAINERGTVPCSAKYTSFPLGIFNHSFRKGFEGDGRKFRNLNHYFRKGFEGDGRKDGSGCHPKSRINDSTSLTSLVVSGTLGDGRKDGSGCHPKSRINGSTFFYIVSGLMVPAIGSFWIFWSRKQKKVSKRRRQYFELNGGVVLENTLPSQRTLQIFKAEDLITGTEDYAEHNILPLGQQLGETYFKGLLFDGKETMIKRCPLDGCDGKNFIANLVFLSQVRHRNVVELIGCCLETPDPMVVYELVTTETLYDHIHVHSLAWDVRLKIAAEIAGVLEYLHTGTTLPIIHGNLNSSNIFVLNGYALKVHGFRLIPSSVNWFSSGYLDPEYLLLEKLTIQNDVYSFGVVLAELLTGKDVGIFDESGSLAKEFMSSTGEEQLMRLMDTRLLAVIDVGQLMEVAKLVRKCLSSSSVDRPSMKEVGVELEKARNQYASLTIGMRSRPSQSTAV